MKKQILLLAVIFGVVVLVFNCSKKSEQLLYKEAQQAIEGHRYEEAVKIYKQIIKAYPKSPDLAKTCFNLGIVYFGYLNDQKNAEEVWKSLLKKYPQYNLEKDFFDYAQKFQDEEKPLLAIKLYEEILNFFPQGSNRDKALFLTGFVYSEQLKDYTKAKEIYEKFIKEYPQSDLKDDAEYLLKNLGKETDLEKTK
jgi:outer membrane protein assembly factor BamD (BamD/ComL family)